MKDQVRIRRGFDILSILRLDVEITCKTAEVF